MNGWIEYRAIKVSHEGYKEVHFKVPENANDNEIWYRAKEQMLNAYGHPDVTCWERIPA